jgi:ribonuclease HI
VELGEFDLEFYSRTTIKAQVLTNFIAEFSNFPKSKELPEGDTWIAYVDGSSMKSWSGAGVALITLEKEEISVALKLNFPTTNNEAEYEAVIAGLSLTKHLGAKNLEIRSDSQVVVGHIQGGSEAKGEKMIGYLAKVRSFWDHFERVVVTQVPRTENERADALAWLQSTTNEKIAASKQWVLVLDNPFIANSGPVMQIEDSYAILEWARNVVEYLKDGRLPNDKKEARKIWMQSARYTIVGEILYCQGHTLPLLKCLSTAETEYVLKEIHKGVCGSHSRGRMLAHKAVQAGYYWPTMNQESMEMVRRCDKCQRFVKLQTNPPVEFSSVLSPWPFAQWGVDIVGPMPTGKGNCRFLVVAVDYFTKWAEAEPLATITTEAIKIFLWKAIVCRFGISNALVTDNGTQFDCRPFQKWCSELKIRHFFSSVYHPQSNGQVEATIKTLVRILKKKLPKRKGGWVEYLPEVMWSYWTTTRSATSETP